MTDTGFYPQDTRARPEEIRASAERLEAISGVLLGHGENVGAVLSQVALSFSEVIAPAVAAQIGNNVGGLEAAVEGTQYGYAVGTSWASDVETFSTARAALIAAWEVAEMDDFGVAPLLNLWPPGDADEVERLSSERRLDVEHARGAALRGFIAEGHALWEVFQDRVVEKGRMFREGPTADNLARLVATLGWGAMTLWPEIAQPPVSSADGVTDATTVIEGLDGTASRQAVAGALADVAAIIRRAESGHELTAAEIDYLAAFYETLEGRVTEVPGYLAQTSFADPTTVPTSRTEDQSPPVYQTHTVDGLDPTLIAALSAASANGMLVLSRNGPGGGGYQRLPSWVQDTLDDMETPFPDGVGPDIEDYESLRLLGELLAPSTVSAGEGLTRELGLALGRVIPSIYPFEDVVPDGGSTPWGVQVDAMGQAFLDVISRNGDVASDLITGSDMPPEYSSRAFILDVYSFEWSDDGASAAGLTGFITANADGADPAQGLAAESMRALFDIVSAPGSAGFEDLMDQVGNSGEAASSSLGQVNPEISAALGSLMASYLDEFGMPEGNGGALGDLTIEARARFATLAMTSPAAGQDLVVNINEHTTEQLSRVTDSITAAEYGRQGGRLLGLVDVAAVNIVMDQIGDEVDGVEDAEERRSIVVTVMQSLLGRVPFAGPEISAVLGAIAGSGDAEAIAWPDIAGITGDTRRQYGILAGLVEVLSQHNRLPGDIDPSLLDAEGNIREFDELDGGDADAARARLELAIEQALGISPGDVLSELDAGYEEVAGQLPQSPEVYENAIER